MPPIAKLVLATEWEIKRAKTTRERIEYRIKDARNLVLRITRHGCKTWVFRYGGGGPKVWLGTYPETGLIEAKEKALAVYRCREAQRFEEALAKTRPQL